MKLDNQTKHMAVPSFSNANRPIVTLGGCTSIHGNSGSPIVDSLGHVRATLEGGQSTKFGTALPFVFGHELRLRSHSTGS